MNALTSVFTIAFMLTTTRYPSAQDAHAQIVFSTLDANKDGTVTCDELAQFLNTSLIAYLRRIGVEPGSTSGVPPCGPRNPSVPSETKVRTSKSPDVSPESDFAEYLRELVQSALNTAMVVDEHSITLDELTTLLSTNLSPPLTGRINDLFPPAPTPAGASAPRQAWTDLLEKWVNIRQSFLDEEGIGRPAKISLTNHAKSDTTVEAGFPRRFWAFQTAVILDPPYQKNFGDQVFIKPVVAYELAIASNTPNKDQIVHRFGASTLVLRKNSEGVFSSHIIDATFDYRTERHYDAKVLGTTIQYSPNYRAIGIGQYLGHGKLIDFRWRPYAGLVWAGVKDPGQVEAYKTMSSFTHEYIKTTLELKLGDAVKITPESTMWHGPRNRPDDSIAHWQNLSILETRWILSESKGAERASLAVTGSVGRDSPDFKISRQFLIALALKF